jgi:hypothetical protein
MNRSKFIPIKLIDGSNTELRFINTDHIIQIYLKDNHIHLDLIDYNILKLEDQNINLFMDRFVLDDIYNNPEIDDNTLLMRILNSILQIEDSLELLMNILHYTDLLKALAMKAIKNEDFQKLFNNYRVKNKSLLKKEN